RCLDVQPLEAAGPGDVAQPLQGRAHQRAAAVAVVKEAQLVVQRQAVGGHALPQRGHLAGDGVPLGLLLGRDAGVDGGADGWLMVHSFAEHRAHPPWATRWDWLLSPATVARAGDVSIAVVRRRWIGTASSYTRLRICCSSREPANSRATVSGDC